MAKEIRVDVKENKILEMDASLLSILLKDNSSGKNLIWATDNYAQKGFGYGKNDTIEIYAITGANGNLIKPRTEKTKQEQLFRVRDKAEVFTPSWICNKQNNLVDNAWFGRENVFNTETEKGWTANEEKVTFPDGKTWQDYVKAQRLEITCGEAPYLASRYDTVTGEVIPVKNRIGLLDRKLRIVSENVADVQNWYAWAKEAYKSIYGYDWQGDNVLLARENLLFTFCDFFEDKFGVYPKTIYLREIAKILAWNIWQMDGLKFVIPNSCHNGAGVGNTHLEENRNETTCECEGCKTNNRNKHNGVYCYVMDWEIRKKTAFVSLLKK